MRDGGGHLFGRPLEVGGCQVEALVVLLLGVENRVANVVRSAIEAGGEDDEVGAVRAECREDALSGRTMSGRGGRREGRKGGVCHSKAQGR